MILKNCELWYCKLDPERPNARLNKDNPTWEVQIRTTDKETKNEWEALNLGVKAIVPDDSDPYYRVNLKKRSLKKVIDPITKEATMEPTEAPSVVDGNKEPLDPNSIGHGSIGNVKIFQYPYTNATGRKAVATILIGLQVTKHIVYVPQYEDFDTVETETVEPIDAETEDF